MRPIKFRAWDKENHKILPVMEVSINQSVWVSDSSDMPDRHINAIDVELMQFTGLLDKNGKEIYEGDIVKWGDHCGYCHEDPVRIAEVKLNPDIQFDAKNVGHVFEYGCFAYKDTWHLEVIGNIYENPELLK